MNSQKRNLISVISLIVLVLIILVVLIKVNPLLFTPAVQQERIKNETKFKEIINYISSYYVDEVNWEEAYQSATRSVLEKLDPHSVYVSATEVETNEESFQGQYQGIGIQFDIIDGYITVITAVHDSPADKVGLLAGDRIVKIDGKSSIAIDQSEVPRLLKGKSGTSVQVTVLREGISNPLEFTIIREAIPLYTVSDYFMNEDSIGYIYLNRFAKTTEQELDQALTALENQGMQRLVLDLRWNAGGLLDQAVKVSSRFLPGHRKVVFTRGRLAEFDEEFYTDTYGRRKVRDYPLVVLINYASASAAEIVAGALQDYDRGLIVGTTSFGKGLVQREFPLRDNSRLRLTISKYYTPSGRLIQKPYKGKNVEQYYEEPADSLSLKYANADSTDTLYHRSLYYTSSGRKVYGGGGINPDVVIEPVDQIYSPLLIQQIREKHLFFETAAHYTQNHQYWKDDLDRFLTDFKVDDRLLGEFTALAAQKGLGITAEEIKQHRQYIAVSLKAEIARNLWGNDKYHRVLLEEDNQYQGSLKLFPDARQLMVQLEKSKSTTDSAR
jgi:carboxyl-terminal processing protease